MSEGVGIGEGYSDDVQSVSWSSSGGTGHIASGSQGETILIRKVGSG